MTVGRTRTTLAACAVGAVLTVMHPWVPAVPGLLIVVTLLPLIHVSVRSGPFLVGMCWSLYAATLAATVYSGVHDAFGIPLALLPVAAAILAFFIVGVLFALLRPAFSPGGAVWLFPVAFVAAEATVSPQVVWNTFTVVGAGLSTVAAHTPFLLAAPWSGQGGVSLLVAFANVALYLLLGRRYLPGTALALTIAVLLALPGTLFPATYDVTTRVALVQGNLGDDLYQRAFTDADARSSIIEHYAALHEQAKALEPDLIVYPETNLPGVRLHGEWEEALAVVSQGPPTVMGTLLGEPLASRRLRGQVRNVQTYQFGTLTVQPYRRLLNVALLWDGRAMSVSYEKRSLFPFGETYNPGRFMPPTPLGDAQLGFLICYDSTIPKQVLERVRHGSTLLVVTANTSFAAESTMPLGHLMISQLMAAATRRSLVHVSQSGPSALIGPDGRFVSVTLAQQAAVAVGTAPIVTTLTPYARYGDWAARVCLASFLGLALLWLVRSTGPLADVRTNEPHQNVS